MDDQEIIRNINRLVDEEHALLQRGEQGELGEGDHGRLRSLEVALDQCWDLLRQRRAAREVGNDPDAEQAHSTSEVEGYLQ